MSSDDVGFWLGLICAFVASSLLVWWLGQTVPTVQQRLLARSEEKMNVWMRYLHWPSESVSFFVRLMLYGPPVLGLFVWWSSGSSIFGLLAGFLSSLLPGLLFRILHRRRRRKIDQQLPAVLTAMADSTRAGMSLEQMLYWIAEKSPRPIGQELDFIGRALHLGDSIENAIIESRHRIDLPNYSLVMNALLIYREKGGDLTALIGRLSDSLREIYRLEEKVKTETAASRLTARIMAVMPIFLYGALWFLAPDSMADLIRTRQGNAILILIVGLIAASYLWIRTLAKPSI